MLSHFYQPLFYQHQKPPLFLLVLSSQIFWFPIICISFPFLSIKNKVLLLITGPITCLSANNTTYLFYDNSHASKVWSAKRLLTNELYINTDCPCIQKQYFPTDYVIIMSCMCFRVNLHSIVAWMPRNSLANLAKWLSVHLRTKWLWVVSLDVFQLME